MSSLLSLLAYDREDLMVAALAGLMVAGVVVAIGAWWLFFRVVATTRKPKHPEGSEPEEVIEIRSGDPEP